MILFFLIILAFLPANVLGSEISTLSFNDLNLQKHDVLIFYSNGTLLGDISSNESIVYNNTFDLNVQIIPNRMDLATSANSFQSILLGYLPVFIIILLIIFLGIMFVGLVVLALTGDMF